MKPFSRRTLSALFILVFLTACTAAPSPGVENVLPEAEDGVRIGFAVGTLLEERWPRDRDVFMAHAKKWGATVLFQNANNSHEDQMSQVEHLLNQNIDVLVLAPHDAEKSAAAVEMAHRRGIKVIAYDRLILDARVDAYVGFDNIEIGRIMATAALKANPDGQFLIINGAPTDNNSHMYNSGFMEILDGPIARGEITLLESVWADDWNKEIAYRTVDRMIRSGAVPDAIIAANDTLAGAAIEALAVHRLAGIVTVVGHDADLSGCQRVAEGTQLMTVYKPIQKLAERAVDLAIEFATGEGELTANRTIYNGVAEIPFHVFLPVAVTRDNLMETVIRDGFHKEERIFQNVPDIRRP